MPTRKSLVNRELEISRVREQAELVTQGTNEIARIND